jgi:Ni,Fe-hydrogenase I cytochrome b subunit
MDFEISNIEKIAIVTASLLLAASLIFRIYLFLIERTTNDEILHKMLEERFLLSLGDMFALVLLWRWPELQQDSKRRALPYIASYLTATLILIAVFVPLFAKAWL